MNEDRSNEPLDKAAETAARIVRAAGQTEKIAHSIQAVHAAAGAVRAGGAASGATVGTALGGPLGTLVGALLTSKTVWNVIGSILLTILLFAYLLVNSVSLIFMYLGFADADAYVSQARTAECNNIKIQIEALFAADSAFESEIYGLVEALRDKAAEEIRADYDNNQSGYDGYEVDDEYETVLKPKLSQYLAVLMEETWNGKQIEGFNGYGTGGGTSSLTSAYDEYFTLASATYQVSEVLLKAMAKAESDFNPNCVSSAGAIGIMQLMPETAVNLGVTNPYDPKQNIMGGANYISQQLAAFSVYPNGLELAIAAYNAGPGAVKRAGYQIPQNGETPAYVQKVLGYMGEGGGNTIPGITQTDSSISKVLLKSFIDEKESAFFDWAETGTHTETIGSGDEEEEIEIVDYSIVVKLNPHLSSTGTGYSFRYVTDPNSFNNVLKLFQLVQNGKDGALDILFKAASWKNYILGLGASGGIYTSTIATGGDKISYETVPGCVREVVYYNQGEEPWASLSYGGSTIRTSGCGPTALAIVISTLTGEQITPEMTAQYAMDTGGYVSGRGTSHAYPANAARNWGLSVERVRREQMNYVVAELKNGKLAVVICAENTISGSSGHFIVLTGVTSDGNITIADPGSRGRTGNLYSPSTIRSYARDLSDGGIWIIGE